MSGGLFALLDDVAALARMAAASVDDIGAAAGRASVKAAGVVVDDTAGQRDETVGADRTERDGVVAFNDGHDRFLKRSAGHLRRFVRALPCGEDVPRHNRDSCIPAMRLLQVGKSRAASGRLADVPAPC